MTPRMRWAVIDAEHQAGLLRSSAAWSGQWARIGGRTVVWAEDGQLGPLTASAMPADGLGLVTQVGAAFLREHPEVQVLLEAGRHLVVDLGSWRGPSSAEGHDWALAPMPPGEVVVGMPAQVAAPADPAVSEVLERIDPDRVAADLDRLVGFGTRHSLSEGFAQAAAWAAEQLEAAGFEVRQPVVQVGSGESRNVVGELPGTGPEPRSVVVIGAHLDSVNLAGGPDAPAPGADDNASGSAGSVELARVIAATERAHDVRVILFGGEEQGLFGSSQYVAGLSAEQRTRVRGVVVMDMIGTQSGPASVLLEGAPSSVHLIDDLAAAAATYTTLGVTTSLRPFASDHVPFLRAGVPAVLTIEGNDSANQQIHTDRDTLDHVSVPFLAQILRMNAATALGWLG